MSSWHWLQYNFSPATDGARYFAPLTVYALAAVDNVMPGFAAQMVDRLEGMGGRERDQGHYEQIVQWLAELLVVHHLVTIEWPTGTSFSHEPTMGESKKNPEVVITVPSVGSLGVEVKCPDLSAHRSQISYEAACQASALPAPDSCPVLTWFAVVCGGGSGARRHSLRAAGPERRCGWS